MTYNHFSELEVWQLARSQCNEIFELIQFEPFSKDWALKDQINRSSGSVMDNIAEGFDRGGTKELIRFLLIAKASNSEVQSQLYRTVDRQYISIDQFNSLFTKSESIRKMIIGFIKYLKKSEIQGFREHKTDS